MAKRIIYSAGNRIGSELQLSRFLKNINKDYELKIAGYVKSTYNITRVDWLLNSAHKRKISNEIFINTAYNSEVIENILKDVIEFGPDLIISDNEHIFGYIANEIEVPLWYCSPLNLIDGIDFGNRSIYSYFYFKFGKRYKLPQAERYLIYSPFCDIKNSPKLKNGYEWVRPYYEDSLNYSIEEIERRSKFDKINRYIEYKDDYTFTDGHTDIISDSFYNNKKIIIVPSIDNVESLLNGELVDRYNIGYNLGQVELMEMLAIEQIEKTYNGKYNEIELNNKDNLQLHEMIDNFAT